MSKIQVNDIVNHYDDGAPNFPKGIVVGSGATLGFNVGTGASIYSPSDNVLTLGTNNSERLRITSSGKVGIGLTNPEKNLVVSGSSSPTIRINNSDGSISSGQTIGAIEFKANDGSGDGSQVTGSIESISQAAFTGQGSPSHLIFKTNGVSGANALTERLRITSGGNVDITGGGNLIINADSKLHLEGDDDDDLNAIWKAETENTLFLTSRYNIANIIDSNNDDTASFWSLRHNGTTLAGSSELMRVTADAKLILSGTARTTPFISGDGGMCIEQNYDGNLRALSIRNKSTDAAAATSMCFSLNRSGGDQDFTAGEIKLIKEQSWTTASSTVDGAMAFSTILNGAMTEKLRITSNGTLLAHDGSPSQDVNAATKLEVRGPALPAGGVDVNYFKGFKLALDDATEWGSQAQFAVGRYEESGSSARSSLVISLGHGGLNSASDADVDVMEMRSNGCVMKPKNPAFGVYNNQSNWNVAANTKFDFDQEQVDSGGNYDTGNARFTAPVTGSYQVNFHTIIYSTNTSNASVAMKVNGSNVSPGGLIHWSTTFASARWHNVSYSRLLYLIAGDYLEMWNGSVAANYHGGAWCYWSGFLIG